MKSLRFSKPDIAGIPPYYQSYVAAVKQEELMQALHEIMDETMTLLGSLGAAQADHRYAPGKWSVKEVIAHITDAERIFAYRALRFSRRDAAPLQGFDENAYAPNANAGSRSITELLIEFQHVRSATIDLYSYMTTEMAGFRGTANNTAVDAHTIGWIIAGHNAHHLRILRERYL